jgi:hypothetical protein
MANNSQSFRNEANNNCYSILSYGAHDWQSDVTEAMMIGLDCLVRAGTFCSPSNGSREISSNRAIRVPWRLPPMPDYIGEIGVMHEAHACISNDCVFCATLVSPAQKIKK